ncbi:DdpA ABC-type dipeptide transport system, periplasmic component [Rhabdaerophilaceae bacterium]
MVKFRTLLGAAALVVSVAATPLMARTPAGVLVVAKNIDDIVSLDPAQAYEFTSGEVVSNIYERLIEYNPLKTDEIRPAIASSWKVSDDGKTIAFAIRQGAKFASGNPVRPDDVVYSFKRVILLNKAPSFILKQFGWTPENIDQMVRKTGDSEVSLTIAGNFAPSFVLNALGARVGSVVDALTVNANAKDNDWGNGWLSRNSAGSGSYMLGVWRANETVVLRANPNAQAKAKTPQVVLSHVPEASTQRLMIEAGDADIVRNLGPDQIAAVRGKNGVVIETYPQAALHFLSLNVKHEKLNKPALWEAIRYLIDYDGIADTLLKGQMKVHQTFWPTGFPGAVEDRPFKLDVAKAKDILDKAGIKDLMINVDIIASAPFTDIAQSMQSTMAQAGIKLNLQAGAAAQVITKYRARQHEGMLLYWGPDFMDPHSNAKAFAYNVDNADGSPQSTTTWRNSWHVPELSAKTLAALVERDAAKRLEMYRELQREVLKQSPWAMTFQAQAQVALRENVKGFVHGATNDLIVYRDVEKK